MLRLFGGEPCCVARPDDVRGKMPEVQTSADAVAAFCALVVGWMAVWFVLGYFTNSLIIARFPMDPQARKIAVNKAVALLHAVYATAHATYYHNFFAYDEPSQAYHCSESTWRSWRRIWPAGFVGYLVLDFVMEIRKGKPGVLMLVHHAVFTAVALISMAYEKGCKQYTVTLMSEASTVVFVARWFFIKTGQSQALIKASEILFAALFFVLRVIFFGHGTWISLTEDPEVFADASVWQVVPTMYIIGYVMQLWWMYEIVLMAVRPKRSPSSSSKKKEEDGDKKQS